MPRSATCPHCGALNRIEEALWDARVRCRSCGDPFRAGHDGGRAPRWANPDLERRPPRVRKESSALRTLLIIGGVLLGVVLGCGLLCGGSWFFFIRETEEKVTDAD